MAFAQVLTYVDGAVLEDTGQTSNDTAARTAVNQKTWQADFASGAFDFDDLQRGEFDPITNSHQFTTGDVYGKFTDKEIIDRAYFTSETKANDQTVGVQYQEIYHTGDRIIFEELGKMFITFGGNFVSVANLATTGGPGTGKWDSEIYLKLTSERANTVSYIAGTLAYSYEETGAASAGTTDPISDGVTARRWIGWQWMIDILLVGAYQVSVVINPKVEMGYASARSFTCETFYV